jgi:hypothetical protein
LEEQELKSLFCVWVVIQLRKLHRETFLANFKFKMFHHFRIGINC